MLQQGQFYKYRSTPLPEINLSPAQILFHRQLRDHLPVKPCPYHLHKDWIISSKQREDYAHRQNQQTRKRYDSPVTREKLRSAARARWDKTGMVVEKLPLDNIVSKLQDLVVSFYVTANLLKKYPYQQITALFCHHCIIIQKYKIILTYNQSIHQVKQRYQIYHKMSPILCIMMPHWSNSQEPFRD